MRTDTERLDALEKIGNGLGLIEDDNGYWAVGTEGHQNIRCDGFFVGGDLETVHWIEAKMFRKTIREAIDVFLDAQEEKGNG